MRPSHWILVLTVVGALVTGCATGPDIRVDKDPNADLRSFKTFGFFDEAATDDPQYSTIITERLKQATRPQLERNGYTYAAADADLRVNFHLNVAQKQEARTTGSSGGYYGYRGSRYHAWGGYPYDVEIVDYREGTLTIDLVDAKRNALVWQGVAEGRVSDEARKNPGPAIDAVVAEIFSNFPDAPAK